MNVIYLMLPVSLLLALIFLIAYVWSVRTGQYEDTHTPSLRILTDDVRGARNGKMAGSNPTLKNS